MTNSTPKSNNKIERQGSPNSHGKQKSPGQRNSNYVKTVTYFASSNNTTNGSGGNPGSGGRSSRSSNSRQSCSPPCSSTKSIPRSSPMRYESPRGSPTNSFYAGPKFSEPPSPASLPKPPSHWTGLAIDCQSQATKSNHIFQHLKMILNVQA
ncbi:PREDICTED: proline-rich nuclear receptor coactivator 2 [Ceratosolen solmsi marchali]|uniref:Proline-rich nuclear receptor coactivator 2 n=1 Tax=Ceratosolen solmsi marchali TaxID=326594 RepID=A0AAJ6YJI8_9HYME|nr:PREDICTED: proline-rich nuclear receptor coactivator 2 [Ceratosolen solmsi marchali]